MIDKLKFIGAARLEHEEYVPLHKFGYMHAYKRDTLEGDMDILRIFRGRGMWWTEYHIYCKVIVAFSETKNIRFRSAN